MADILNWGFLSTARINKALVPPLNASKRSKLLGVASREKATAEGFARHFRVPRSYGSYDEMLRDPDIDVVYNSLPNSLHAEWTVRALQAGKHVLCEKPLALSLAEVDSVIDAARASGKICAEAFMYRHHPQTIKVKELIEGGAVGKVMVIRGAFCYRQSRENDIRMEKDLGGGSLWDVGCYPISFARYIAEMEPISFMGWQISSRSGIDLSYAGQMVFPGEICTHIHSSLQSPYNPFFEITGSEGRLLVPEPWKPSDRSSILIEKEGRVKMEQIRSKNLYIWEVADMENAVLDGTPPRINLKDSRGNVAAILGLLEAARTKKVVP